MSFRSALLLLVYALPLLVVLFAVTMACRALSQATGDAAGAGFLWRLAIICLVLLVTNVFLLVGALGIQAIVGSSRDSDDENNAP